MWSSIFIYSQIIRFKFWNYFGYKIQNRWFSMFCWCQHFVSIETTLKFLISFTIVRLNFVWKTVSRFELVVYWSIIIDRVLSANSFLFLVKYVTVKKNCVFGVFLSLTLLIIVGCSFKCLEKWWLQEMHLFLTTCQILMISIPKEMYWGMLLLCNRILLNIELF